ncbi:hypothetical protein MNBD_ALPHA11-507, partial [hydrothermal vent metagenome]
YVNVPAMLIVGIVAASAAPIGAAIAHRLDHEQLKFGFGIFLLVVAVRMLWQVLV